MNRNARTGTPLMERVALFCLGKKLAVLLGILILAGFGLVVAPFDWDLGPLPRHPVPVDAIPDIGDNQQIVFTEWPGRSPQDVEDQITYPLTISLMGIPGVRSIRSSSAFGFSSIYIIFNDSVEFYWARSRILEKLGTLSDDILPPGVKPVLGPDATALGQVFWYTLEGLDRDGNPVGGFDSHELRTIQDWYVRYSLLSTEGVAEVASVGGHVREYQVDVDPNLLRAYDVRLEDVVRAVNRANLDVGASTVEINNVEYLIRGLGYIRSVDDLRYSVITTRNNSPTFLHHVAHVSLGPALRVGALDKNGHEAVGGVVAVRYGENPLEVISSIRERIAEISPGLPERTLADGTVSKVTVVPFYDRTELIQETLSTLSSALTDEILVTVLVIMIAVMHLGGSLVISVVLPLSVLATFIAMKIFGVDANIVALAGIAIAIGAMADMAIILTENIVRHMEEADGDENPMQVVVRAAGEVSGAIITAIATTVISFLPVFTLVAAEGKLFRPLAFTKTFTLLSSLVVALTVIPPLAHILFTRRKSFGRFWRVAGELLAYLGLVMAFTVDLRLGAALVAVGTFQTLRHRLPEKFRTGLPLVGTLENLGNVLAIVVVLLLLTRHWLPLGPGYGLGSNLLFAVAVIGGWLAFFRFFQKRYPRILKWCLENKRTFLAAPLLLVFLGGTVWLGFDTVFGWLPAFMRDLGPVQATARVFPGLSREFMPPLDEGSFLYMPSTMPHASIREVQDIVRRQDKAIGALPEVETVVGKLGRADSPLDPAPVSMIETLITFRDEYLRNSRNELLRFAHDSETTDWVRAPDGTILAAPDGMAYKAPGRFLRDERGRLIPAPNGEPFRIWRPVLDPELNPGREAWTGIRTPDDIWESITRAAAIPGTTTASRLQPISARLVMLQSGIRAAMAVKVKGPDIASIQKAGNDIERLLREVDAIDPLTVVADRIVAKPYLEIEIDRRAVAQYGFDLQAVQDVIETAIGGKRISTTVEGRERYSIRVRYQRELRDSFGAMENILVSGPDGYDVPLGQLAKLNYRPGPMVIRTEDSFLTGYVIFDARRDHTTVDAVEAADRHLADMLDYGGFELPSGVSYDFVGTWENHVRTQERMTVILPLTLAVIFIILYFQFNSASTALLVFSGVAVAWAGGFVMLWLYGQGWFLDIDLFGMNLRDLFQIRDVNLSLAVWVGFLALFGIATDDGVLMATHLDRRFSENRPANIEAIRQATIDAGMRRIRPCLMTTATTVLALIPVLTSRGRGSDILVPMAIPSFGGMVFAVVTILVVPVAYCALRERELRTDS